MTGQTKYFIELDDIVAYLFECTYCHATMSLAISSEIRTESLRVCPNCKEGWTQLEEGSTIELSVKQFFDGLKEFKAILGRRKEFTKGRGFRLSHEINPDSIPTDKK
jgi:hypothetical protein